MRRTKGEWAVLIDEWRSSGETIQGFCERKALSIDSFKRWKRTSSVNTEENAGFMSVILNTGKAIESNGPCRIMIRGIVAIECYAQTNPKALETAIKAAVAVCGPTSAT